MNGTILEVAKYDSRTAPRELAIDRLAVRQEEDGERRLLETVYQARVQFELNGQTILPGTRGYAKISARPPYFGTADLSLSKPNIYVSTLKRRTLPACVPILRLGRAEK